MANRKKVELKGTGLIGQIGEIIEAPLSDIDKDSYENQRSGDWGKGDTDISEAQHSSSFKELVDSIRDVGLKDAVTVRPHPNAKSKFKYQLIKGFRRFGAIETLASENEIKRPVIKVVVKDLNDLEAFDEHVTENTARDNLKGPDLGFAAFKMLQLRRSMGESPSNAEIARRMGKHQGYINDLIGIIEKGPAVAVKWRNSPVQLSVNEMKSIVKLKTPEEQDAQYDKVLKRSSGESDDNAWVQLAADKAARGAAFLGRLQKEGLIATAEGIQWGDHLKALGVSVKEGAKASQIKTIADAAHAAFDNALNPPPVEPKATTRKGGRKGKQETGEAPEIAPN